MVQSFILAAHKNPSWFLQMNMVLYNTKDKGSLYHTALSWLVTSKFQAAGWREREKKRAKSTHALVSSKRLPEAAT